MRTKVRHVDLHPDEFLAAVAGEMSPAELGVYWMICLLCYARGGDIDADADWIRAKFRPGRGNRVVGEILESLIADGKVVRDGSEIGVRRVRDELEIALRRIRDAHENGSRGGRKPKNANGVEKPTPFFRKNLRARNHQPPGKEEGFSPKELNPDFLTAPCASPPLPSQGDGVAAPGAREGQAETVPPDEALNRLDETLAAIRGKLGVVDLPAPPLPDPRLVEFRARLVRLNALAGRHLDGNTRWQAWEVLAQADAFGHDAIPPPMLAELAAIESLDAYGMAAE